MARELPLERNFQTRVLADLARLPRTFRYKAQASSLRGIPDVIASVAGCFVALELKRSTKHKPSAIQKYTLDKIAETGAIALVAAPENWGEIYGCLAELAGGKKSVQDLLQRFAK